ncbi:unnamed protein product [Lampetra fluviatilis]
MENLTLLGDPGPYGSANASNGSQPADAAVNGTAGTPLAATATGGPYQTFEVILIAMVTGSLSLVTVVSNILVMVSIKVNRQLQTVNNYFLFSLACADFFIGAFSMNLYTLYIIAGRWPLGALVCDLWLALDYVASNASVMNLLIISFDRYFCVTKPLAYPTRRTTRTAGCMIAGAWALSFVLWAPAILFWQHIVGERTVPDGECSIQFLSNPAATFGTAIAAFYLPVAIMIALYARVSRASRSRVGRRGKSRRTRRGKADAIGKMLSGEMGRKASGRGGGGGAQPGRYAILSRLRLTRRLVTERCGGGAAATNVNVSAAAAAAASASNGDGTDGAVSSGASKRQRRQQQQQQQQQQQLQQRQQQQHQQQQQRQADVGKQVGQALGGKSGAGKKKKQRQAAARERKVTRTIFAILLAFIITWTPYNVMVLITTFCDRCVPAAVWIIGYWLCYINSTINPACYALCNAAFKKTFKRLLLCQYKDIGTAR